MVRRDITMRILPTMCMLFLSLYFQVSASPNKQGDKRVSIDANNTTIKEILKRIENQTGVTFFYNTSHVNDKERVSINVIDVKFEDLMKRIFRERGISWLYNDDVVTLQTSLSDQGKKRVSFTADNITLKDIFKIIQKQTGLEFYYNVAVVNVNDKVNLTVKDRPLDEVLGKILTARGLGWQYFDNIIRIKAVAINAESDSSITSIQVTGKVTDAEGTPIPGATIIVKGTSDGTTSDGNGEFSLANVSSNRILVIRYLGFKEMEFPVERKRINVRLTLNVNDLDETVVIAYGTTTRRLNTGSVSTIRADDIAKQSISNPLLALQGRVPGMTITQQTGIPGGDYSIQIRGQNSIGAGNSPLYIVDGVPFPSTSLTQITGANGGSSSPLNSLNPYDIESIDILKDADATAIYGSRGANGVVLITTKKGRVDDTKFGISLTSGIGKVTRLLNVLNTPQYLMMRREAFRNDNRNASIDNAYDLLVWDTTKYTDWQKEFIGGTAKTTNVRASLTGGNSETQFMISGAYYRETTVLIGDDSYRRASMNANINNTSMNGRFKVSFMANYSYEKNNLPRGDPMNNAITLAPNTPDFIDNYGNLIWVPYMGFNPYALLLNKYKATTASLISNANISYKILPSLELKSSFGYNSMMMHEISTAPTTALDPASGVTQGSSSFAENSSQGWIIEPQINWRKSFGKSKVDLLVGTTFQESLNQGNSQDASGYTNDALLEDIKAAGTVVVLNSLYTKYRYSAVFGRLNYNFDSKYLLNVTARRDGSSRFGPGKQFANFGAVGIGWIFSNEKILKGLAPMLSYGKLRSSYGITGNDGIPDYGFLALWTSGNTLPFLGTPTLYPARLPNADYAWEKNKKFEVGLELGFLSDKVLFSTSWYRNRSSNQLVGLSLPPSTGDLSVQSNLPAVVQNTGLELELRLSLFKGKKFTWSSYVNGTFPSNKLVKYPNFEKSVYANTYEVGKSLYVLKGYHFLGVDPKTGVFMFEDFDGNGKGTDFPGDLRAKKSLAQEFYGGWSNTLELGRFQLDFLFQFVKQTGLSPLVNTFFPAPGKISNQPIGVLDRWQKDGDLTDVQRFTTGSGAGSDANRAYNSARSRGDNKIVDASFVRLKSISLSYKVPKEALTRVKLRDAMVTFQGQNILTLTSYKGGDPESQRVFVTPPLRTVTVGLQITL